MDGRFNFLLKVLHLSKTNKAAVEDICEPERGET